MDTYGLSYLGGWGGRISWAGAGGGCKEPSSHHCTPAWVIEWDPVWTTTTTKTKKETIHLTNNSINIIETSTGQRGKARLGVVARAYNPSTLGGRDGWITRSGVQDQTGQHGKTPSLWKIQKLARHGGGHRVGAYNLNYSRVWGRELLEPRRLRLQLAKITPGRHSETPSQQKTKQKQEK